MSNDRVNGFEHGPDDEPAPESHQPTGEPVMPKGPIGSELNSEPEAEDSLEPEDFGLLRGVPDEDDDLAAEPEQLRVRRDDPSGTIMLDRPDCRNALSRQLIREIGTALEDLRQVRAVRAVIMTGRGSAFCAGTDLRELESQIGDDDCRHLWFEDTERLRHLVVQMLRYPKPIIAAVNGPVCGAGLALVLAADIVVAGASATFSLPEPRRGLVATQTAPLLQFRIGAGQAAYLLMSSRAIEADVALRMGLAHEVVADDLVWARAQQLAGECAAGSREALILSKRILNETIGETLETFHAVAAAYAATARTTETAKDGVRAFLDKRPHDWP
ncbi:MAG: enoyl-CoA hydratase/isomerase family protein [Pirellulaceae bacterium]|nr:enoyl-CoA hydratase/isomerase family protein [Planctomycetales bacterium]